MPEELLYLGGFLGQAGQGWLQVAMLVCLFLAPVLKPGGVGNRGLFIVACLLFALSIVISPMLTFAFSLIAGASGSYGNLRDLADEAPGLILFAALLSPMLLGTSVVCGLLSLLPSPSYEFPIQRTKNPPE